MIWQPEIQYVKNLIEKEKMYHVKNIAPMKTAFENRFLKVNKSVILTTTIEPVIIALESYFEAEGKVANVTSGLRDPASQLSIIRGYLAKKGMDKKYPEAITCGLNDKKQFGTKIVYAWQMGWSALLNVGIIINPPIDAECLMDYIGSDGKNRKGTIIKASSHFLGTEFDIGGGTDGIDGSSVSEMKIVQKALADKKIKGLVSIVLERNNNCVHCSCVKV